MTQTYAEHIDEMIRLGGAHECASDCPLPPIRKYSPRAGEAGGHVKHDDWWCECGSRLEDCDYYMEARAGEAEGEVRLDVERLARAMMEALTPGYREGPGSKAYKTMHRRRAEAIAAEYARLASPEPDEEASGKIHPVGCTCHLE